MFEIERIVRVKPFTMPTNHFHPAYEIFYLEKGQRDYFIRDRTYRVTEGGIVLIDRFELHRTIDTGIAEHTRYLINFKERFLNRHIDTGLLRVFSREPRCFQLDEQDRGRVERLITEMLSEYKNPKAHSMLYLESMLVQLLILLTRIGKEWASRSLGPDAGQNEPHEQTIHEIASHIRTHYAESLSLSSVAQAFFLTPSYLSKIFKKGTGFSFVEYVQHVRTAEAQRLLRETDLKVADIAELTGFRNLANFGRVFKQITSVTPLQYRKKLNSHKLDGSLADPPPPSS